MHHWLAPIGWWILSLSHQLIDPVPALRVNSSQCFSGKKNNSCDGVAKLWVLYVGLDVLPFHSATCFWGCGCRRELDCSCALQSWVLQQRKQAIVLRWIYAGVELCPAPMGMLCSSPWSRPAGGDCWSKSTIAGGLLVLLWLASRERMLWVTVPPRKVEGRDWSKLFPSIDVQSFIAQL